MGLSFLRPAKAASSSIDATVEYTKKTFMFTRKWRKISLSDIGMVVVSNVEMQFTEIFLL